MRKVRLAGDRTERGELRAGEAHDEVLAARRIGYPLQLCRIGTKGLLDVMAELRQAGIIRGLSIIATRVAPNRSW
jgi:hypothetical protein